MEPSEDISEETMIDMLLSKPGVIFENPSQTEKVLELEDKRRIVEETLKQGALPFLKKFGHHLEEKYLNVFHPNREDEELCSVLEKLKMVVSPTSKKLIIKNRRYEALSRMTKEDSYFSEVEMMRRKPLLYEHLVGQYLSEDEKRKRDNIDTKNITLLNVLLEGIDRDHTRDLKKRQQEEEDKMEELDEEHSSDESEDENIKTSQWGEFETNNKTTCKSAKDQPKKKKVKEVFITAPERSLLREEFIQEMYRSFLAGEDADFDYSTVDDNTDYDCVQIIEQDEEDDYFDSETPDEVAAKPPDKLEDSSEDELDAYMDALSKHPALQNLKQCE